MHKKRCEGESEKDGSGTSKKFLNDLKTGKKDINIRVIISFLYIALCR